MDTCWFNLQQWINSFSPFIHSANPISSGHFITSPNGVPREGWLDCRSWQVINVKRGLIDKMAKLFAYPVPSSHFYVFVCLSVMPLFHLSVCMFVYPCPQHTRPTLAASLKMHFYKERTNGNHTVWTHLWVSTGGQNDLFPRFCPRVLVESHTGCGLIFSRNERGN